MSPFTPRICTAPDETKAFFGDLTTWLEDEGGLQVMANYLHSLNIEAFNFRFPPHTEAKDDITEVSTASEDRVTHRIHGNNFALLRLRIRLRQRDGRMANEAIRCKTDINQFWLHQD